MIGYSFLLLFTGVLRGATDFLTAMSLDVAFDEIVKVGELSRSVFRDSLVSSLTAAVFGLVLARCLKNALAEMPSTANRTPISIMTGEPV